MKLHPLFPLPRRLIVVALFGCCAAAFAAESTGSAASTPSKSPKPAEFLIVLRLTPKYHEADAWTSDADKVVGAHFTRLKDATARGQVILAGRTNEPHDKTLGLVVFTAEDEAAARKFMDEDPCIVAGIMSGTLHPYSVALLRK